MDKEVWKDVPGYEGRYQVSNYGQVRSIEREILGGCGAVRLQREILMKQSPHYKGYKVIFLNRPGSLKKKFFVHRLVAIAFIENTNNKPIVNHKNGDRSHNHLNNLEWMDESENVRHGNERRAAEEDVPF